MWRRAEKFAKLCLEQLEVRRVLDGSLSIVALELADSVELSLTDEHERLTAAALRDLNGDGYADLIVAGVVEIPELNSPTEPEGEDQSSEESAPGEIVQAEPTEHAEQASQTDSSSGNQATDEAFGSNDDASGGEVSESDEEASEPVAEGVPADEDVAADPSETVEQVDDFPADDVSSEEEASSEEAATVEEATSEQPLDQPETVQDDHASVEAESSSQSVFVDAYLFQPGSGKFNGDAIEVFGGESDSEIHRLNVHDGDADSLPDVSFQLLDSNLVVRTVQTDDGTIHFDSPTLDCHESCDVPGGGDPNGEDQNANHSSLLPIESFIALHGQPAVLHVVDLDLDGTEELITVSSFDAAARLQVWSNEEDEFVLISSADLASEVLDVTFGSFRSEETSEVLVRYQRDVSPGETMDLFSFSSDLSSRRYRLPAIRGSNVAINLSSIVAFELSDQSIEITAEPSVSLFREATTYDSMIDPLSARVVDINGDGIADVVGKAGSDIEIQLATRDGEYVSHTLDVSALESFQLFVDRFEEGFDASVAIVGSTANGTQIHRVDFEGSVPRLSEPHTTDAGIVLEVLDLDNDGLTDFVFRSDFLSESRRSFVVLNRSDNWFTSTLSTESATVAIQDLDNDSILEAYVFEDPIRIFRFAEADDGQGEYQPWGAVAKGTTRAQVTDVNADGLLDFISFNKRSNEGTTLTVYANGGDGTWDAWDPLLANTHELVDINGDGLTDIASRRFSFLNRGDGSWDISEELESDTPEWSERDRYVDLNGDGVLDVAKYHATTGELSFHELSDALTWEVSIQSAINGMEFELVDLNSDGYLDLFDANNGTIRVTLRDGKGWSEPTLLASEVTEYALGRNQDGLWDLSLVDSVTLATFSQSSGGIFVERSRDELTAYTLKDVNGDFQLDLELSDGRVLLREGGRFVDFELSPEPLASHWDGATLAYVLPEANEAAGSKIHHYATPYRSTTNGVEQSFLTDLDGDGDEDFLAFTPDGFLVLHGTEFEPAREPEPVFGDFDNSGSLDATDIDLLHAVLRESNEDEQDLLFDVNADGRTDALDASYWIEEIAGVRRGDADFDGDVDFSDFLQFSIHFGDRDASWTQGDFDGNGVVSFPDFLVLTREFGGN